jgi:hypothetical protein
MGKYIVACSGWLTVEVEANSEQEAIEAVEDNATENDAGLLYDLVIDNVVPAAEWREP